MTHFKPMLFMAIVAVSSFIACKSPSGSGARISNEISIPDSDTLSYHTARKYVKNYAKNAGVVRLAGGIPDSNSRCVWFSLKRLDTLVKLLNKENADGVRFYFAAYDTSYKNNPNAPRKIYWGHNTLLMVSTKDSTVVQNGQKFVYHHDYYTDINQPGMTTRHGIIILFTDPENRGEICPPPSNCASIGATLLNQ